MVLLDPLYIQFSYAFLQSLTFCPNLSCLQDSILNLKYQSTTLAKTQVYDISLVYVYCIEIVQEK